MADEFKREDRYIVIKKRDLTLRQANALKAVIHVHDVTTTECVVVEADWDCYDDVWKLVEQEAIRNG